MKLEPCIPPLWAKSGHAQTILGYLLPSPKLSGKGRRVEITLTDGDRLVGFIQGGSSKTVVYIFHGLAGSTDSTYIHRTAIVAQKLGHTVFLVNHRGCGEGAGLAKGPYHSGRAEDLAAAIAYGRTRFPAHRHVAIGFSMSGNALLLLLSGRRGRGKPDAGISVNAPIHLERSAYLLKKGLNRVYDIKFYRQCRRDVFAAQAALSNKTHIPQLLTLHDFDNIYTAPAGGFANREDYYQSCSTHALLSEINTPTLVLTTKDDPFVPFQSYADARLSGHVQLHAEECGGHMGYLSREKTPLGTVRWQDYALSEALRNI
jgi:predicted alpha/beta-fold hydrolase